MRNIISEAAATAYNTVFRAVQRHDLSAWDHAPAAPRPVYGVYHVYCDKGWRELVADQIGSLKRSGLYAATTRLYVSCIAAKRSDADELRNIIGGEKTTIVSVSTDPTRFEYPALEFLRAKACGEDCLLYYFHTKGISYYAGEATDRNFMKLRRNVDAWRRMMEYFIFDKWQVAVNTLADGYDTYGCYRLPPYPKPYYMYAGNFWWASSDYVRKLPRFPEKGLADNRFMAEEWLYKAAPRDFSAFDTLADLYFVYADKALYASRRLPVIKWLRFVLTFNWVKTRKHLLKYDYKKKRQLRYQAHRKDKAEKA